MNRTTIAQLFWFTFVGAIGFVVDAGVLYAGIALGAGYYGGRVVSYICAATTTWYLNRRLTFKPKGAASKTEWLRFVLFNLAGFTVNYGTYAACLAAHPLFLQHPVLAVGAGSAAGLLVNFSINKYFVFGNEGTRERGNG